MSACPDWKRERRGSAGSAYRSEQLDVTTSPHILNSEQYFPLLDLPGELRNRIYEAAAYSSGMVRLRHDPFGTKPCRSYLALAHTSKQIRAECLPIFMRAAKISLEWEHVEGFFDLFYPTVHGAMQNTDTAPSELVILVPEFYGADNAVVLDVLPMFKMNLLCSHRPCMFKRDPRAFQSTDPLSLAAEEAQYADEDAETLSRIMAMENERLKGDVASDKLRAILWSRKDAPDTYTQTLVLVFKEQFAVRAPDVYLQQVDLHSDPGVIDYDVNF